MTEKKAVAYLRVSGRGQEDGDGFARQRAAIEQCAAARGIEITEWYQDVQTGKDEWQERPGWSTMIASLNGVRTVIVEKLDRVARAVLVQELIIRDLAKREVSLITASGDEATDETPERVMFRQLLAVFAEYERATITLKLRGARQRMKEETGRCEGRKPFGEKSGEDQTLQVMRQLRSEGLTYSQISDRINERGLLPRGTKSRGVSKWHASTVAKILRRNHDSDGFVYVMRSGNLLRIGFSVEPETRRKDHLRYDIPMAVEFGAAHDEMELLGTIQGGYSEESAVRRALKPHNINGSWYPDCTPVRAILIEAGFQINQIDRREFMPTPKLLPDPWK